MTVMEDDLRLCTVRPSYDLDRRFCFEVLSPTRFVFFTVQTIENETTVWPLDTILNRHRCNPQADRQRVC